jgi:hypothetical protein
MVRMYTYKALASSTSFASSLYVCFSVMEQMLMGPAAA